MSEKTYRVNPKFREKFPNAVTLVDGVSVTFSNKDLIVETPGTLNDPPKRRVIPAMTQEQMKYLKEVENHPAIEIVEPEKKGK